MALQDRPGDERIQKQPHQLIQSLRDVPLCEQALPPAEEPAPHGLDPRPGSRQTGRFDLQRHEQATTNVKSIDAHQPLALAHRSESNIDSLSTTYRTNS